MTDFPLSIEKIAGAASSKVACAVFTKRVALFDGSIGTLASCILLRGQTGADLQIALGDVFEILTKKLEDSEGSVLGSMRFSCEAALEYLSQRDIEINFCEVFFYDEVCYVARSGPAVRLLIFEGLRTGEINLEFGSGPVGGGQIYLLATEKFLKIFETSRIKGPEADLGEIIDEVATAISGQDDQSEIAAIFVKVNSPEGRGDDKRAIGELSDETEAEQEKVERSEEEARQLFGKSYQQSFKNPIAFLWRRVVTEVGHLKSGEARAMVRFKRNIVIVACLVLLILAISAVLTLRQREERAQMLQFQSHFEQASAKYEQAVATAELNKLRAREFLVEAEREIKLALEIKESGETVGLREKILAKLKETEGASEVSFKTLAEVSRSFNSLGIDKGKLIGFAEDKIFEIDQTDGSVEERKFEKVRGVKSGFFFDNEVFLVTDLGVVRVDLTSDEVKEVNQEKEAVDIGVFLGNVYLLLSGQIAKIVPIEGGYAEPIDYLNSKEDFSETSRLAIDGSIWVTGGKAIYKFTRGKREDFAVSGLVGETGEFGIIYTSSDSDDLYVIDRTNSALLVIGKDGAYRRLYQSMEFARASDLVVDGIGSKIYVAVASRILEAGL